MELIEIVDIDGNFTGEILEKSIAHDRNLLHNEICVFIINNKKQVLLQKRSANKRFGANKWALCEGHVQAKESVENAALRELKEEVGLELKENKLIPFGNKQITNGNINSHVTYFFYTVSNLNEDEFVIQLEELSEVKWFNIKDVIELIQSEDNSFGLGKRKISLLENLLNNY